MTPARPLFRIAWRNVLSHWRHTLGSILSIVVGFVAIGLFEGYLHDLEQLQENWYVHRGMMGHLIVETRGRTTAEAREDPWAHSLGPREQAVVDRALGAEGDLVATRVRFLEVTGLASTGRSGLVFLGYAFDVPEAARLRADWAWNATSGVPLQNASAESVIVGNGLGSLLDCQGAPPERALARTGLPIAERRPYSCRQPRVQLASTTEHGQLNVVDPTIAGMMDVGLAELDARFLHMPLGLAQRLLDTESVSFYAVLLRDGARAEEVAARLREAAAKAGLAIDATEWRRHPYADLYVRTMSVLGLYRTFVVVIVVTIAGMSVFTTMLKAVNERVREIGTLRSLGYRRRHIVSLFTLEAALLAMVSAALGIVATAGAAAAINAAKISYKAGVASTAIPLTVSLLPSATLFAVVFLSGVAVAASLLPARRAARLRISDALGHV